jgi:Dyggve-Melchior-Clausen syndrome protein
MLCAVATTLNNNIANNRKDVNKSALMHVTNFTLLKLSGERNFGVSLNKPYTGQLHPDLPPIRGTHCDLIMLVLHKVRLGFSTHCKVQCPCVHHANVMALVCRVQLHSQQVRRLSCTMLH